MLAFEVAYHGHHFTGWHRQRTGDDSVQATLERCVKACLTRAGASMEDVRLNALTDVASAKGAHSRGQLCFFRATPEALALAPGQKIDTAVSLDSRIVLGPLHSLGDPWPRPSRVHAAYFIQQGQPVRELAPFSWYVREILQPMVLQRAAAVLEGTHDLSTLSRRTRGRCTPAKTTIEQARVTLLPATVGAFDLQRPLSWTSLDSGALSKGAESSWLIRLDVLTAEGSGSLPSQLMQRLAALLRRVGTRRKSDDSGTTGDEPEELASEAESTVRAVLDGSIGEAEALPVAPARGLWLEQVALQNSDRCTASCSSRDAERACDRSVVVEPPAKRASTRTLCSDGSKAGDAMHEHPSREVQVHTMSARVLLAPTTEACWVGPTKPGSQRLRVSDYDRLLQLHLENAEAHRPHVVVGVNSAALPQFFTKVWPRVHANTRCVIVSADSDWGVPGEVWAKNRQRLAQQKPEAPIAGRLPPLQDVLEDSRLVSWFTQNYDFGFGCHLDIARSCCSEPHVTSSCSNSASLLSNAPLHKLKPLPIGLDFHSLSQKATSGVIYRGMRASSAECQQADLDAIAASLPPFSARPVMAYGSRWRALSNAAATASPFAISQEERMRSTASDQKVENASPNSIGEKWCPRARALKVFSDDRYTGHVTIESEELNRSELWRRHGNYSFVISPPGHGLDCHRTWEALALGCIPITLAPMITSAPVTPDMDSACASGTAESAQAVECDTGVAGHMFATNNVGANVEKLDGTANEHIGVQPSMWHNPLFSGLPVVVVQRWEDVTEQALHTWRDKLAASFDPTTPQGRALTDALRLEHWCSALQ